MKKRYKNYFSTDWNIVQIRSVNARDKLSEFHAQFHSDKRFCRLEFGSR